MNLVFDFGFGFGFGVCVSGNNKWEFLSHLHLKIRNTRKIMLEFRSDKDELHRPGFLGLQI